MIPPKITKDFVLSRVTEELIFSRYLGEPIEFNTRYRSPLRDDSNPTCTFKLRNGRLMFKDWSGHFAGDCFDFVMKMFGVSFIEALKLISQDFNLIEKKAIYKATKRSSNYSSRKKKLEVTILPHTRENCEYWIKLGVTKKTLLKFRVYPIRHVFLDGELNYSWQNKNPGYVYILKKGQYKVYFPYKRDFRFLSNAFIAQGVDLLPESGELCVITKSYKDVMCLYELGITSFALANEVVLPTEEQVQWLRNKFDVLLSLYDFDLTGIKTANQMRKKFNIKPFFLTNGRFRTENFHAKDLSDYITLHGFEKTKKDFKDFLWQYKI
jgi:hypothetical protein